MGKNKSAAAWVAIDTPPVAGPCLFLLLVRMYEYTSVLFLVVGTLSEEQPPTSYCCRCQSIVHGLLYFVHSRQCPQ